jgi:hypothetical protein
MNNAKTEKQIAAAAAQFAERWKGRGYDRAVMAAYGFDVKTMTESTCVAELFKLYQKLTKE